MLTLTKSQAWVAFDRDRKHKISLRAWQKEAWNVLFGHFKFNATSISHQLNTMFMPEGTNLVAFDAEHPEEFLFRAKQLLEGTDYDINILVRPREGLRTVSEEY